MPIPSYEPMVQILPPEGQSGNAKLSRLLVSQQDARFSELRAFISGSGSLRDAVSEGAYARLHVDGCLVMSDTPMERDSNYRFLMNASRAGGDVLVGGLGLGMILVPLLKMDNVTSVRVIEKSEGVVALVVPPLLEYLGPLGRKLSVVQGDILTWKPEPKTLWDCIYFDIWADICTDNLDEIATLKRRFARRLNRNNPSAWMGAWQEERLRSLKRREQAEEREQRWWRHV
jgi:hypothetical protein